MKCPINGKPCNKHKGFHVTEKHGEDSKSYSVCEDCLYLNVAKGFTLPDSPTCDSCGGVLEEMLKASRMGCAKCYDNFAEEMTHIIAAVQFGSDLRHVGNVPDLYKRQSAADTKPESFVSEIKKEMIRLTERERYEEVAKLKRTLEEFEVLVHEKKEIGDASAIADFIYEFRERLAEGL